MKNRVLPSMANRETVAVRDQSSIELPEGGKARRVYLLLRDEIANGHHAEGSVLPSEQRLADMHNVSRVTIRRALDALARGGMIIKKTGAGSIVTNRPAQSGPVAADMTTLIPQIVEMGRTTTARLLSVSYVVPSTPVRSELGLDAGDRVQTAVRVRLADGVPFSHLTTHVPEMIAANYSETDLATTPLYKLIERSGERIATAKQTVSATLASPDVAAALDVSVGTALMSLKRTVFADNGRGVEYLSALYRPDMFSLEMQLSRVGGQKDRHWELAIGQKGDGK